MEEKEILERQVEALEKLLQLKEAIIQEQEVSIEKLKAKIFDQNHVLNPYPSYPISIPSVWQVSDPCSDGSSHLYPSVWTGTNPPCSKCGKHIDVFDPIVTGTTVSYNGGVDISVDLTNTNTAAISSTITTTD